MTYSRLFLIVLATLLSYLASAQDPNEGLLLHYDFNDDALDQSANNYNGIVAATLAPDRYGIIESAYTFDGIDDYIDFPQVPELRPELPLTLAAWVYFDNLTPENTVILTNNHTLDNHTGVCLSLNAQSQVTVNYGSGLGTTTAENRRSKEGETSLEDGRWYHIVAVVRGAMDMDIYLDCENDGGVYTGSSMFPLAYSTDPGSIGRKDFEGTATFHFRGSIDEVRYGDRALSSEEVGFICPFVACEADTLAFADVVVEYLPECADDIDRLLSQPDKILGPPNFEGPDVNFTLFGDGFVSLGEGGEITVAFTDNVLTNSGDRQPDLWVYEIGEAVQSIIIEVRPANSDTEDRLLAAGFTDSDVDTFYQLDTLEGSTTFLDIDGVLPGLGFGELVFDQLRIIDVMEQECLGNGAPGADIDAICALSSIPPAGNTEICNNNLDDDGDGFIDCDDPDLQNDCCCLLESPTLVNAILCPGDSIIFGDLSFTIPGVYDIAIPASTGCDSLFNLTLENFPEEEIMETATICEGDSYEFFGFAFASSGTFDVEFTNQFGCTETAFLFLTVTDIITEEIFESICPGESVVIGGVTYDQPGVFNILNEDDNGCTTDLTIIIDEFPAEDKEENFTICEGEVLEINGQGIASAGTFVFTEINSFGCEEILTVNLEVLPQIVTSESFSFCEGESVVVRGTSFDQPGDFTLTLEGQMTCDTLLNLSITEESATTGQLSFTLENGQSIEVNGVSYNTAGQFIQNLTSVSGCDSTLVIDITDSAALVYYDFDACDAGILSQDNSDYSEFVPVYPTLVDCGVVTASTVFRDNPIFNQHSCTPGLNDTPAVCISSFGSCNYVPSSSRTAKFSLQSDATPENSISIGRIEFYQQAPETFVWINGDSGPNNYPTELGIRILVNGEVFLQQEIPTSLVWKKETVDFSNEELSLNAESNIEVQLFPFCPVGIDSEVSAWDLEDLRVFGNCNASIENSTSNFSEVNVYPNPSAGDIVVSLMAHKDISELTYRLTDLQGNIIVSEVIEINSGHQYLELDNLLSEIRAGVYLLHIFSEEHSETKQITKF